MADGALRLGLRIRGLVRRLAALIDSLQLTELRGGVGFLKLMGEGEGEEGVDVGFDVAALERLVEAWSLESLDIDLLALALMPDEHEGYASVLSGLHPRAEPRPTIGLAAQLLAPSPGARASLRRRLDGGVLVRTALLQVGGDAPVFNRSVMPGPGVAELLRGDSRWPDGVVVEREDRADAGLGFERWLEQSACRRASAALGERLAVDIVVLAEEPPVALERARVLAAAAGCAALIVKLEVEPPAELGRQIAMHAIAGARVPIVVSSVPERSLPELTELPGPALVCTSRERLRVRGRRAMIVVECERLGAEDLRGAWARALPDFRDQAAALVARFPIEPGLLGEIAADLDTQARIDGRASTPAELFDAIRVRAGTALRPGMCLRRPTATWERLVLARPRLAALHEALARINHQARVLDDWGFLDGRPGARGVRMLFCGPPGTGKTLAAEVLAHALGTDLLVVDLSRVVSKWIGETEKNLAEVFASAERSRAVLLFDEADALFGKRTEISDAHDRYANLETAYLLTRLEQYEGLAVLATNLRRNLDAAFVRRLEFIVEFELPDPAARLRLWQVHLPTAAPLDADVELRELAEFYAVTGALIRNAAVAAAFMAAERDGPITRALLLHAIRREYEKTGAAFPGTPPTRARRSAGAGD